MSPEKYKLLAADLRGHMENTDCFRDVLPTLPKRKSSFLPGGERRSVVPVLPPGEDLSALNPAHWKKGQTAGQKNGLKKSTCKPKP